jgi:ElaB/YqjD/DUF883 family membrane-anchored ribosome-binding protein
MTEAERSESRAKVVDAVRRGAHLAHQARLVKSLAADALDDAVYASKQMSKSLKRRMQNVSDWRYELAHQVRREPFKALGLAFGTGILLGAVTAAVCVNVCGAPKEQRHL